MIIELCIQTEVKKIKINVDYIITCLTKLIGTNKSLTETLVNDLFLLSIHSCLLKIYKNKDKKTVSRNSLARISTDI